MRAEGGSTIATAALTSAGDHHSAVGQPDIDCLARSIRGRPARPKCLVLGLGTSGGEVKAHLRPETSALVVLSGHADFGEIRPVIERGLARGDVVPMHALLPDGGPGTLRAAVRDLQNHSPER